jgi:hypothetical protein
MIVILLPHETLALNQADISFAEKLLAIIVIFFEITALQ